MLWASNFDSSYSVSDLPETGLDTRDPGFVRIYNDTVSHYHFDIITMHHRNGSSTPKRVIDSPDIEQNEGKEKIVCAEAGRGEKQKPFCQCWRRRKPRKLFGCSEPYPKHNARNEKAIPNDCRRIHARKHFFKRNRQHAPHHRGGERQEKAFKVALGSCVGGRHARNTR